MFKGIVTALFGADRSTETTLSTASEQPAGSTAAASGVDFDEDAVWRKQTAAELVRQQAAAAKLEEIQITSSAFLRLPILLMNLEGFFFIGLLCCLDFMTGCLMAPIRLLTRGFRKSDILALWFTGCGLLAFTLAGEERLYAAWYHWIRAQSMLKLYVIYNMLEAGEKLLASLANDCGDQLFHAGSVLTTTSVEQAPEEDEAGEERTQRSKASSLTILTVGLVTVGSTCLQTVMILLQVITINVALNSDNNGLATLLLSNNFSELKSALWKKHGVESLFQILCQDLVERVQYVVFVAVMLLQHWQSEGVGTVDPAEVFVIIVLEMAVDVVKHFFICKYNRIPLSVYKVYHQVLLFDIAKERCFTPKNRLRLVAAVSSSSKGLSSSSSSSGSTKPKTSSTTYASGSCQGGDGGGGSHRAADRAIEAFNEDLMQLRKGDSPQQKARDKCYVSSCTAAPHTPDQSPTTAPGARDTLKKVAAGTPLKLGLEEEVAYTLPSLGLLPNPLRRIGFAPYPYLAILLWSAWGSLRQLLSACPTLESLALDVFLLVLIVCLAKALLSFGVDGLAMRFLCRTMLIKRRRRTTTTCSTAVGSPLSGDVRQQVQDAQPCSKEQGVSAKEGKKGLRWSSSSVANKMIGRARPGELAGVVQEVDTTPSTSPLPTPPLDPEEMIHPRKPPQQSEGNVTTPPQRPVSLNSMRLDTTPLSVLPKSREHTPPPSQVQSFAPVSGVAAGDSPAIGSTSVDGSDPLGRIGVSFGTSPPVDIHNLGDLNARNRVGMMINEAFSPSTGPSTPQKEEGSALAKLPSSPSTPAPTTKPAGTIPRQVKASPNASSSSSAPSYELLLLYDATLASLGQLTRFEAHRK